MTPPKDKCNICGTEGRWSYLDDNEKMIEGKVYRDVRYYCNVCGQILHIAE